MKACVEVALVTGRRGHVLLDCGGAADYTGPEGAVRWGGLVELRLIAGRALQVTVWTELAHDLMKALNLARWRRLRRRHPEDWASRATEPIRRWEGQGR